MSGFIERSQEMSGSYPLQKLTGSRRGFREEVDIKDGRVLPNAVQVEQEVLGGILISTDAIERVIAVFGEESDTIFYDQKHRLIYKAMLRLYQRREAIDLVTLTDELKRSEELEAAGGYHYIAELTNKVSTAAN